MSSNTCSIVDLVKLITRPAAVMNMISHSHAYSLYPKETFDNMRSLVVRSHDSRPKMVQALEKYKQRGWDVVTSISVEEASDSQKTFGRRYRFVGDSASWVYPLPDIPCVFFALFFLRQVDKLWSGRRRQTRTRTYQTAKSQANLCECGCIPRRQNPDGSKGDLPSIEWTTYAAHVTSSGENRNNNA